MNMTNRILFFYLTTIMIAVASITACNPTSSPTQVPEPVQTATTVPPTKAPTVTPTVQKAVCLLNSVQKNEWSTEICETFDNSSFISSAFKPQSFSRGTYGEGRTYILENRFVIDYIGKAHSKYLSGVVQRKNIGKGKDFLVSAECLMECNYRNCGWGIAFGGDNDNFYLFRVNREGWYTLELLKNKKWFTLIKWKSTSAYKWDENNKVDILVEGHTYQFFINDQQITTYDGDILKFDNIYLTVIMGEGVAAKYYFDNILLKIKK